MNFDELWMLRSVRSNGTTWEGYSLQYAIGTDSESVSYASRTHFMHVAGCKPPVQRSERPSEFHQASWMALFLRPALVRAPKSIQHKRCKASGLALNFYDILCMYLLLLISSPLLPGKIWSPTVCDPAPFHHGPAVLTWIKRGRASCALKPKSCEQHDWARTMIFVLHHALRCSVASQSRRRIL